MKQRTENEYTTGDIATCALFKWFRQLASLRPATDCLSLNVFYSLHSATATPNISGQTDTQKTKPVCKNEQKKKSEKINEKVNKNQQTQHRQKRWQKSFNLFSVRTKTKIKIKIKSELRCSYAALTQPETPVLGKWSSQVGGIEPFILSENSGRWGRRPDPFLLNLIVFFSWRAVSLPFSVIITVVIAIYWLAVAARACWQARFEGTVTRLPGLVVAPSAIHPPPSSPPPPLPPARALQHQASASRPNLARQEPSWQLHCASLLQFGSL